MKRNFLILIFCLAALYNCKEKEANQEPEVVKIPEGIYVGTFQCNNPYFNGLASDITMTFTSNTWEGTVLSPSESVGYYPGLCRGSYSIADSTVIFVNECAWNTYLDWTHILNNEFYLKTTTDKIEFYRIHETYKDLYKLTRQN